MNTPADELFQFEEEAPVAAPAQPQPRWRVLVVDDESDVHAATELALARVEIVGRQLELLHAETAQKAFAILEHVPDIAVLLLDVVMETPDAGLQLVHRVRRELGNHHVRIILRTGQPGYAPELEAIRDYDINDYRTKSELTRARLYTSLTAALRSYAQLRDLDRTRQGLERIIIATRELLCVSGLGSFADGVLTQLTSWLGIAGPGLLCVRRQPHDGDTRVIAASGVYLDLFQQPLAELLNQQIREAVSIALDEGRPLVEDERLVLYFRTPDQDAFAIYVPTAQVPNPVAAHLLQLFCENMGICAHHLRLIERLSDSAFVDPLLRIPNRNSLLQMMEARQQRGEGGRLLLLDLHQFAETNETFGFQYADDLLRAVSARLAERFAPPTVVARVAADTFALLGDADTLQPEAVQALFATPFPVQGEQHIAAVCIGTVELLDNTPAQDLIKDASMALKTAKLRGPGNSQAFVAEVATRVSERTRLLHELRAAFENSGLYLVYQPQIEISSGECIGFEALMRWRNERGEQVPPDCFIPIAEQSGLIVSLGEWALREALATLARLKAAGFGALRIAVNVSPAQLQAESFYNQVVAALERAQVDPHQLEIEVTESVAILGTERAAHLLGRLRGLGLSVALDDFGTGYSSLSYLQQLPLDRIKIDRAFVAPMLEQPHSARIVDVVLLMGHDMGLKVVAEGVETEAQLLRLRELGCDEAQGYYLSRPLPAEQLLSWLQGKR